MNESFEPLGIKDGLAFNKIAFVEVQPILSNQFLDSGIVLIQSGEGEVIVALVLLPLFGDFSASPEPNSVDFVVAFNSVDSMDCEAIFAEMIDVTEMAVLEVVSEVANHSFSFVFDVVDLPEGPTGVVELGPQLGKGCLLVLSVAELTLPVIDVEGRLGEQVQRVLLLFNWHQGLFFFLGFLLLFLLWFLLLLWLLFLLGLFLLFLLLLFLLFLFLFFLLGLGLLGINKLGNKFASAKPGLSEEGRNFLVSEEAFVPLNDVGNGGSCLLIEDNSQEKSDSTNEGDVSNSDLVTNKVGSLLELSISNPEGFKEIFLSSFILLLGHLTVSKRSIEGS